MDSSPDQTLLNLVGVHRFEVNQLEEKLALANQNLASCRFVSDSHQAEVKRYKTEAEVVRKDLRTARDHHAAKDKKQQSVIDTLQLELAGEREAHSGLRDNVGEFRTQITAALTELVTHGDLTPAGRIKLEQIIGGDR